MFNRYNTFSLENDKLIEEVADFAIDILKYQPICRLQYHNINHTKSVVNNVKTIGENLNVDNETMLVLIVAAWFHDVGYANSYTHHEDESIKIARKFLSKRNVDNEIINRVIKSIDATRVPHKPIDLTDKIIADADLFNLGTDDFSNQNRNLWNEWNKNVREFTELEFLQNSIEFIKAHRYFTTYAQKELEPKKKRNLAILVERVNDIKNRV